MIDMVTCMRRFLILTPGDHNYLYIVSLGTMIFHFLLPVCGVGLSLLSLSKTKED